MAKRGKRKNQRKDRDKQVNARVKNNSEQMEQFIPKSKTKSKIRWSEKDVTNLRNTVRQFNSKLTRIEKQGKNLQAFMPERLNVKELRENITTRKEYNKAMQRAKAFLKKGAEEIKVSEKGLALTKWEIQQIRNLQQQAEYEHKKYLERMRAGTKKETTGKGEEEQKIPKFDFGKRGVADYEKYLAMLQKRLTGQYYEDKQDLYIQNYITAIYRRYGHTEKVEKLVEHLENLGADKVVQQFYQNFDMTIEFTYDLTLSDNQLFDRLAEQWYKIKAE